MTEIARLLRADLQGRTPYGAPQLDVAVRLNTNENPHPPSPELVAELSAAVGEAARAMNRYPDRDAVELRTDLAAYLTRTTGHPLDVEQVWAANGSNEVLQQLLQAFGGHGRTALGFDPTYSMHRLISEGTATRWLPMERLAGFRLEPEQAALVVREHAPDVVFLCSPNNPTGTALDLDVIEAVYDAARGLVVVDEAYAEFSNRPSAIGLLPGRERLVVTRTMSKAFAFAAARLGYLAADPAVVQALQLVRLPYHLSVLTQAAARAALARADELLGSVAAVVEQRDRLLREIRGAGPRGGRLGRELRALRRVRRPGGDLAGSAGPRRAGARRGAPWLAAGDRRHRGGDECVPRRAPRRNGRGVTVTRFAKVERETKESHVLVELELDGSGSTEVDTGVPFFDHMLAQLGKHGGFDLVVRTRGDLEVDAHHTVEDTAIAVGQALREALGDKAGIRRFGDALVPLDETLVQAAVDLSGRPYLVHTEPEIVELIGTYDTTLTRHIWESFTASAQVCLHVRVLAGRNAHHVVEAQFKAVARALRDAVALDARISGVPSTKGSL